MNYMLDELIYPGEVREIKLYRTMDRVINSGGRKKENKETTAENKKRKLSRVRRDFKRLVLANKLNRSIVLTYKEVTKEVDITDNDLKKFIRKLRDLGYKISYLAVRELQKRESIHYHLLINTYIPKKIIDKVWQEVTDNRGGYTWINKVKGFKPLFYTMKYLTKEELEFQTSNGYAKKIYLCSKGLIREEISREKYKFFVANNVDDNMLVINEYIDKLKEGAAEVAYDMVYEFETDDGYYMRGRSVLLQF